MSINTTQLKRLIWNTLDDLEACTGIPSDDRAVNLLLLTAAQESHMGTYIEQVGGPALGIFQMEPNTHDDIYANFVKYKDTLGDYLKYTFKDCTAERLRYDLRYQIVMARLHYYRVPEALPDADDDWGLAHYWKDHYNTHLGAGTPKVAHFNYMKYRD
jgi:hypothetical protein